MIFHIRLFCFLILIVKVYFIPIPFNLFTPQSYAGEVKTNKICAGIVILYITNLCRYYFSDKIPRASLKGLHPSLLILTITLHGCSLLENAGAYSPEQLLSSINALPISLLTLPEWEIT